jgi:hypothetical protein
MGVHPKIQCFLLQWTTLIGPSQKNYNILNAPQIEFFTINIIFYKRLSFSPTIYKTSAHFWTKDMSQIVMLLWNMLCAHS